MYYSVVNNEKVATTGHTSRFLPRFLLTGSVNKTSNERLFSRRSTHKGISFFYANARSVVNKVDMLHLEVANKVYDVVVLVETHLDSSIVKSRVMDF